MNEVKSSDIVGSNSISNNWETKCLADVAAKFISGGTPSTKDSDFWEGEIPWTTSAPITDRDVLLQKAQRHITQRGLESSASNIVPKGNLIVGTRVGVGKAVTNTIDIAISQDLTGVVLDHEKVEPEFISYYFKTETVQQFFNGRKRGTTIKGISRFDLASLVINLPPLPEQRAIARALHAVQGAREARLREISLERERKAALMEHLFTHGTRGEATKQTEIGEMPDSWTFEILGNIARISSGGTPDRNVQKYWNGNIPWIKTGEIDYRVILNADECITQEGLEYSAAKIIPKGTLLMAMYGQGITRGKVAILGIDAAINQACAAIATNGNIDTNYLFYFLSYNYKRIRNLGHGANQKNLNAALIKSILIPMPQLSDQQEIACILRACDARISVIDHEACLHDELFRAMLEELMSGRLKVDALEKQR